VAVIIFQTLVMRAWGYPFGLGPGAAEDEAGERV
jgi:hypothetical protein